MITLRSSCGNRGTLYLYTERSTVKARNLAADPRDRQYPPDHDPDFDVVYAVRPRSAMAGRLDDYAASQRRWTALS